MISKSRGPIPIYTVSLGWELLGLISSFRIRDFLRRAEHGRFSQSPAAYIDGGTLRRLYDIWA